MSLKDELTEKKNRLESEKRNKEETKHQLSLATDQTISLETKAAQVHSTFLILERSCS
jgi:hypothetical protein